MNNGNESIRKELKIMSTDPVCGMEVYEMSAAATYEYKGRTFYFCSPGCKAAFAKEPAKYVGGGEEHAGHEPHNHEHP